MFFISGGGFASPMDIGTKKGEGKSTEHKKESAGISVPAIEKYPRGIQSYVFHQMYP